MSIRPVLLLAAFASIIPAAALRAADPAPAAIPDKSAWSFDAGADLRLRMENFDDIPISKDPPGVTRGGKNTYYRIRPRAWGQIAAPEHLLFKVRLTEEFRIYEQPANRQWQWPDEAIVDNLYVDLTDLFGGAADLRIGRQDLVYGTGKVILEGTPKDGSRTIYMDAVKLTLKKLAPKTTVDVLGIYNQPENELAINSQNRDLTGFTSAYDDVTESGGGVYVKNNAAPDLPFEAYYLFKQESDWDSGPATNRVHHDVLNLNTVGFRVMPKFGETVAGNLEAAYQFGEQGDADVSGTMIDALVKCRLAKEWDPWAGLGWYYISGDDPSTSDNEGWNPLWSRWPQYSELYVYAWDADGAARWSNVSMPYAEFSMTPSKRFKTYAQVGYMMAPEDNGPGDGDLRGWFYFVKGEFVIGNAMLSKRDKLTGHVWLEFIDPGDYYKVEDTSYFVRFEMLYAF